MIYNIFKITLQCILIYCNKKSCINQTHWWCTKFTGDYGKILHDHNMKFKIHSVLAYLQPLHIDQHVDQDGDEDLQN